MTDGTNTRTMVLWGDTQVGKTALVTAALHTRTTPLEMLDDSMSGADVNRTFFVHWNRLCRGLPILGTDDYVEVSLRTVSGCELRVRDMPGGLTQEVSRTDVQSRLEQADAVLFLVEWTAQNVARQMVAIDGAWRSCANKPVGLVFTKCELGLRSEDQAWSATRDRYWWRTWPMSHRFDAIVERFGDAVWPTSAYGYDRDKDRPAILFGEFGQLIPFHVDPRGVTEPFRWGIQQLGLGG